MYADGDPVGLPEIYQEPCALHEEMIYPLWSNLFVHSNNNRLRLGAIARNAVSAKIRDKDQGRETALGTEAEVKLSEHDTCVAMAQKEDTSKNGLETISLVSENQLQDYFAMEPAQRILFIRKQNSSMPLGISAHVFDILCEELHAPKDLYDYLLYLGKRGTDRRSNDSEVEIAFPPASFTRVGDASERTLSIEIVSGLRYIDPNDNDYAESHLDRWSLRQAVAACSYTPATRAMSWMFFCASQTAESGILQSLKEQKCAGLVTPFPILCALYNRAVRHWRFFIAEFAAEISDRHNDILLSDPDGSGPLPLTTPRGRQSLLLLEHRLTDARLALQATRNDLTAYKAFCSVNSAALGPEVVPIHRLTIEKLGQLQRDLDVNLLRLEHLQSRLQAITTLVSSFLELRNGFVLQHVAQESKKENEAMRELNQEMRDMARTNTKDSAKITVLTILTLIYLPLTVVSNIFSTSFVGTAGNRIFLTDDWWVLLVTTIPLTTITLYVWWVWSEFKANGNYPRWWSTVYRRLAERLPRP